MATSAWTRTGQPVDASLLSNVEWDALKQTAQLGDFVMPCCQSPAVLKTSVNGVPFFAHLTDVCATAPETIWHQEGKVAVLAALEGLGIVGRSEVPGESEGGGLWKADVFFAVGDRKIAIELQRSYQHLRDFIRRQERYASAGVECYWLVRKDVFMTLSGSTARLLLRRDCGGKFPPGGIGTGMLPELPVAVLIPDDSQPVSFGLGKAASLTTWLTGIINGEYQYLAGSWCLC